MRPAGCLELKRTLCRWTTWPIPVHWLNALIPPLERGLAQLVAKDRTGAGRKPWLLLILNASGFELAVPRVDIVAAPVLPTMNYGRRGEFKWAASVAAFCSSSGKPVTAR